MGRGRTQSLERTELQTALFDAGWRAALGALSAVGALTLGATVIERWQEPVTEAGNTDAATPGVTPPPTVISTPSHAFRPAPAARFEPITFSFGPVQNDIPLATVAVLANVEELPPPPLEPAAAVAPQGPAIAPLGFDLARAHPAWRHGGPVQAATPERPAAPTGGRSLDAMAKGWVPDWRTPDSGDISLFVAGDDEALTWALSSASPNRGRVTYQDDRVEVGKLSAGVAMSLADSQVALAYVERDAPSSLGYSTRENMAGVVWTMRR